MNLETGVRSAVAFGVVVADTLVCAPSAIAASMLLGPGHAAVSRIYRDFAQIALRGFGAAVRSVGAESLDPGRRYVFVSNHQSHLDALAILSSLPGHPVRFVAKEELGRIPLFGHALRATGNVFVARADTGRDVHALDDAQRQLLDAVSVLFFAEGTRSENGALGPFKKGAAVFALKAGLPLVPIGVHGSHAIYPRGVEVKRGGTIGVAFGDPIETEGRSLDERETITAELRSEVAALIERSRALAPVG